MMLVLFSLVLIMLFFEVHLVVWRFFPEWRRIRTLVTISMGVLVSGIVGGLAAPIRATTWDILLMVQFHIFVTFAYIVGYSGIEEESPSLMILKFIARADHRGSNLSDITALISDDFLLERRLLPMARADLVVEQGEELALTKKGMLLATIFQIFRMGAGARIGG